MSFIISLHVDYFSEPIAVLLSQEMKQKQNNETKRNLPMLECVIVLHVFSLHCCIPLLVKTNIDVSEHRERLSNITSRHKIK